MGIKELYDLIECNAPEAIGRVAITFYAGKRIAIDGHNWMYKNMHGARTMAANKTNFATDTVDNRLTRKFWIELCLNFVIKWLKFRVIPVFIFDGPHKPEKEETQLKRYQENSKKKTDYYDKLEKLNSLDILDRTEELINEVKDQFTKFIDLDSSEVDHLINILNLVGLPWYKATGEAEQLCSMLAIEGKVDAVYSSDSDNLALGCPVLLKCYAGNHYENGVSIPTLEYYELEVVLKQLALTREAFLDLCILLGCDYNHRIKGIGKVTALKLIKEYGSITNIAKSKIKDISCLKYEECLNNFRQIDSSKVIIDGHLLMKYPDLVIIRDVLETNELTKLIGPLSNAMADAYQEPKKIKIIRRKV